MKVGNCLHNHYHPEFSGQALPHLHNIIKELKTNEIRAGTLGGTLCSIWASITLGDLLQTVVMAALGTLVSYVMSRLLQRRRE